MNEDSGKQAVSILLRLRPNKTQEADTVVTTPQTATIVNPRNPLEKITYQFDQVFDGHATQNQLFQHVQPLIQQVFQGVNGTVFAYGQTGSGKTHTMMGSAQDPGLIPNAMDYLFQHIQQDHLDSTLSVSYIEIYNDKIYDLLVQERPPSGLDIRETYEKTIKVAGITEVELKDVNDFKKYHNIALGHRSKGATLLNDQSSRSHFILQISVKTCKAGSVLQGKLNLIDLAGSEDNKRTGNSGTRMIESGAINKSLFDLGQVVESLNKNLPRVPYRNSKITRFLQDSLGGTALGMMISCIAPGDDNLQDTMGTLNFALKAKGIKNTIQVNEQTISEGGAKRYSLDDIRSLPEKRQRTSDSLEEKGLLKLPPKRVIVGEPNESGSILKKSDDLVNIVSNIMDKQLLSKLREQMQPGQLLSPILRNRNILSETTLTKLEGLERTLSKPRNPHTLWATHLSPPTKSKCAKAFVETAKVLEKKGDVQHALMHYRMAQGGIDPSDSRYISLTTKVAQLESIFNKPSSSHTLQSDTKKSKTDSEGIHCKTLPISDASDDEKKDPSFEEDQQPEEEDDENNKDFVNTKKPQPVKSIPKKKSIILLSDFDPEKLKTAESKILHILNTGRKEEFKFFLKGIGEKRACTIIEHRDKQGPFIKLADLTHAGFTSNFVEKLLIDYYESM